mgnify:CR=1 FL=1
MIHAAQAPDAPPVADTIPGFDFAPVIGLFARAGTPDAIIQKIASEVAVIVKQPDVIKQFATAGIEPLYTPLSAIQQVQLRLREDVVTESNQRELNQQSAPAVEDGLFLVPKVSE